MSGRGYVCLGGVRREQVREELVVELEVADLHEELAVRAFLDVREDRLQCQVDHAGTLRDDAARVRTFPFGSPLMVKVFPPDVGP